MPRGEKDMNRGCFKLKLFLNEERRTGKNRVLFNDLGVIM